MNICNSLFLDLLAGSSSYKLYNFIAFFMYQLTHLRNSICFSKSTLLPLSLSSCMIIKNVYFDDSTDSQTFNTFLYRKNVINRSESAV